MNFFIIYQSSFLRYFAGLRKAKFLPSHVNAAISHLRCLFCHLANLKAFLYFLMFFVFMLNPFAKLVYH